MLSDFVRDAAVTAAIFGFFGMAWFGWAQEHPPRSWRTWLGTGSVLSVLTMAGGALLAWQHWNDGTVFDPAVGRAFGIVVGVEFAAAGIGAAVLSWRGKKEYVPVWIAFVVGVHFFPVAALLHYPLIHVVGVLVTLAAVAAVPVARSRSLPVSAVNGLSVGSALLAGGIVSLVSAFVQG